MVSIPSKKCFDFYNNGDVPLPSKDYLNMTFCLIGNLNSASCYGDKGGPAIWEDLPAYNERAYLFGKQLFESKNCFSSHNSQVTTHFCGYFENCFVSVVLTMKTTFHGH